MNLDCDFCKETVGTRNYFRERYRGSLSNRIIDFDSDFFLMPSIGQLAWGHLLLVSRQHFTALARLPEPLAREAERLTTLVIDANTRHLTKDTVVFEHGILDPSYAGGCGISHLHVHLLPCERGTNFLPAATRKLKFEKIPSLRSITAYREAAASYVYLRQPGAGDFVGLTSNLPSQYMRQAVAQTLGKGEWDWRKFGVEEELISTYRFYREALGNIGAHEFSEPVGSTVEA